MTVTNISGYKFVDLEDLLLLKARLKQHCTAIKLKGTIILSTEGVNLNLSGEQSHITQFKKYLTKLPKLDNILFKESISDFFPFKRLLVKIKKELIKIGKPNLDTSNNSSHSISPKTLKLWLDEGREITLLDVRNAYETEIGTFQNAKNLGLNRFQEVGDRIKNTKLDLKKPMVMFCTGGIRCEKLLPLMLEQGFQQIYQLEGGILNYFEICGDAYYQGECFIFDDRVSLNSELKQTGTLLCKICQTPVIAAQQQSPDYLDKEYCPHCKKAGQVTEQHD